MLTIALHAKCCLIAAASFYRSSSAEVGLHTDLRRAEKIKILLPAFWRFKFRTDVALSGRFGSDTCLSSKIAYRKWR